MSEMPERPRILIANDDGIHAPGLELLERIAREISDDVWVVAPDAERSGAGHSVSLTNPVRMREITPRHFAVAGTPTDCVIMALWAVLTDRRPDIILSGINAGANLGEDCSYSGTIAAAMEGTLLGIRSIALSQIRQADGTPDFATAAAHAPDLIRRLLALETWPEGSFININIPNCGPDRVTGIRLTRQGQRPPGSFNVDARTDTRQVPYYWIKISYPEHTAPADTDLEAIAENAIAVTPVKMDFTDHAWREALAGTIE